MKEFEPESEVTLDEDQPFEFSLRGVAFKARPRMSPADFGAWTEMINDLSEGAIKGNPFTTLSQIIESTLYPDHRKKWSKLMREDFDVPIKFNTLIEIGNALVEHSADRPIQPPPLSGDSEANGGTRSTDDSATRVRAASSLSPLTPD